MFNNSDWLRDNRGWSGVSLNDTIKLADPEKPRFGTNSLYVSSTMPKIAKTLDKPPTAAFYSCSKFPAVSQQIIMIR